MTLDEYLQLLTTAADGIELDAARALAATTDALKEYAQSIAHRRTGNMADTMHRLGPFAIGVGVLEAQFLSGAWYAEIEVARGGEHDWAGRTLEERADLLAALEERVGQVVVAHITGRDS